MIDKTSLHSQQHGFHSTDISIARLRADFRGQVIGPNDPEYDKARTIFHRGIDRKPAVIIRAQDANEVSRVVSLARESGLELAIRSGGHSTADHSVTDGGIVLDLSNMRDLNLDLERSTAWAASGLTAGEYTTAVGNLDLATGFGDTGSVGIGGLTLGGGIGYLVRKYGMTIDNLLAAEIVTADGQIHFVDANTRPDLFWAIRGGGGNFGVVTRFQFRLHRVDSIFGGMLFLPATPATITSFIAEAEAAPDELSTIATIMPAPPLPLVSNENHGMPIIMAMLVYVGDAESGKRVLAPFRSIAAPIADMIRPMRYPDIYLGEEGRPHPILSTRTMFLDTLDHPVAETILDYLQSSTGSMALTQLRVLGGAMARVPVDATAFAHRKSHIMANLAAMYEHPEERATHEAWVSDFAAVLQQSDQGAYVNFLGNEGEARIRSAYPGQTWDRLVEIKTRYDPTNLFHLNQNISPSVG